MPKRFEYRRELWASRDDLESAMAKLNAMGSDGWELVQISEHNITMADSGDLVSMLWFKREMIDG